MEGTIKFVEKVQSASGSTYYKLNLEEPEYVGRKMVSFTKDELAVGQKLEFTYKENPDTSWILTPKKKFNGFGGGAKPDVNLECLRMAVEIVKESKVDIKQLEATARRLKEIYNLL
jgi:hypothetical protein